MFRILQYLFDWTDCVYMSVPFLFAIHREWKVLDQTVECAKAALALPIDDPSRAQMAFTIDQRQRSAFRAIRLSMLAILVIAYYMAPR